MTTRAERPLFDAPVGDFDWGPRRRWRTAIGAQAPLLLAVLGLLLIAIAITQLDLI